MVRNSASPLSNSFRSNLIERNFFARCFICFFFRQLFSVRLACFSKSELWLFLVNNLYNRIIDSFSKICPFDNKNFFEHVCVLGTHSFRIFFMLIIFYQLRFVKRHFFNFSFHSTKRVAICILSV